MNCLILCDTTLKLYKSELTFRKKVDIAVILDQMNLPVIELGEISADVEDRLLIKTIATSVQNSVLAVSVGLNASLVKPLAESLKDAKKMRLQVCAPISTARMEYVYHKKPAGILEAIKETVLCAKEQCSDVEFCADDATRADFDFLKSALETAIEAGATHITLCDTAGTALPDEISSLIKKLYENIPQLSKITLGVECKNDLGLANACAASSIQAGALEIKASACHKNAVNLSGIVGLINAKVGVFPTALTLDGEKIIQPIKVIKNLCDLHSDEKSPFENGLNTSHNEVYFTANDSEETVFAAIEKMGYLLSTEDRDEVFKAFKRITGRKECIDLHELEVIVASEALQVPQTYTLESSVITTGNTCEALAHIKLSRKGEILDGISLGNGSVDASFLAIEKITGCHYELDDFQIQAITEGKEAMGQTLVKLRSHGKVYSGKGVSTDIVISAIEAYLNALNKIAYEEE